MIDFLRTEIVYFVVLDSFVKGAQKTIRIAEYEPSLFGGIGSRLAQFYPRFSWIEGSSHSTDADQDNDYCSYKIYYIIMFVAFDFCGRVFNIMPAIDEESDEYHTDDSYREVMLKEVNDDRNVVAVACEVYFFGSDSFHRMRKIHHIRCVKDNH